MLRCLCLLWMSLFLIEGIFAQASRLNEYLDPAITNLLSTYQQQEKASTTLSGFKVQVVASTDRKQVETALAKFKVVFPTVPADWVAQQPYYKLLAGAYTNKWDAIQLMYSLKSEYPSAFITKDNQIKKREIVY